MSQVFKTQPQKPQSRQNKTDYKFIDKKQSTYIAPWSLPKNDNLMQKNASSEINLEEVTPPAKHLKIPVDQLLIIYTTQTKYLLKLEDKITYKCETLSLETYSPVISGLRTGIITALEGRKITINRIIPLSEKNVESFEEKVAENDIFFLHNFKELWIDKTSLDEIRREDIERMNLIDISKRNMLKELENRILPKEREIIVEKSRIQNQNNENKDNQIFEEKLRIPEKKPINNDILAIEKVIGTQVNIID